MQNMNYESYSSEEINKLRALPEFLEMKMRAEAAENKLRKIYGNRFWRLSKPIRKLRAKLIQRMDSAKESNFVFERNADEGTSVIELVKNRVLIESQNADLSSENIALIAQFSDSNLASLSLNRFVKGLIANNYAVVVISASEQILPMEFESGIKEKISVINKPNLGYDFGSWAVAFEIFPQLFNAKNLILTNDSLIGPLEDLSKTLQDLKDSNFDVTGITDSSQLQYHIQSYLVHLNERALQNSNVQNFLKSIVHLGLKNDIILKYELGLTRTAQLSGLYVGALFPWNLIVQPDKNPSLAGWKRLMDLGFPFLKKEAVRRTTTSDRKVMLEVLRRNYSGSDWARQEIMSVE